MKFTLEWKDKNGKIHFKQGNEQLIDSLRNHATIEGGTEFQKVSSVTDQEFAIKVLNLAVSKLEDGGISMTDIIHAIDDLRDALWER